MTININFLFIILVTVVEARKGIYGTEQDWGYIEVRPKAHMFWWLYYTTHNSGMNYTDRPLIVWLQGGPGMPASGYGNFVEIGPRNATFHKRIGSFVDNFNVLFIDNPVGVGFSYFETYFYEPPYDRSDRAIGRHLYSFFRIWFKKHPDFAGVPLYIFGESYGGKMATELVYTMKKKELRNKKAFCNLQGLSLGDAYISPIDSLEHFAPLGLNLGLINKQHYVKIKELVKEVKVLISKHQFMEATLMSYKLILSSYLPKIDVYNFLNKITSEQQCCDSDSYKNSIEELMNNQVKEKLGIRTNIKWRFFQDELYRSLSHDLFKSATNKIEFLLNKTDIKILIYNGILDFLVNTAGTISWIESLNWHGKQEWLQQENTLLLLNNKIEGYSKRTENLVFYAVLRAGHSVPLDNLPVMNKILKLELLN